MDLSAVCVHRSVRSCPLRCLGGHYVQENVRAMLTTVWLRTERRTENLLRLHDGNQDWLPPYAGSDRRYLLCLRTATET